MKIGYVGLLHSADTKITLFVHHSNVIPYTQFWNPRNILGFTAFMWACQFGHIDVVKLLLIHSNRIDLNARTNTGLTAFMCACRIGHKDVVQLLLDQVNSNIELNARSRSIGSTAFMLACQNEHKDVVQLLLDNSERIDLNARDNFGRTALMYACRGGLVIRQYRCLYQKSEGHHIIVQLIKAKLNL